MSEQSSPTGLPRSILRPVWGGVAACLLFGFGLGAWSGLAPLATTLRVPGTLSTADPSVEVHHQTGGQVAQVLVRQLDLVETGDPIVLIESADIRTKLNTIRAGIAGLRSENSILTQWIEQGDAFSGALRADVAAPGVPVRPEQATLIHQREADLVRLESFRIAQVAAEAQASKLQVQRDIQAQIVQSNVAAFTRDAELAANGLLPQSKLAQSEERALRARSALASMDRQLQQARDRGNEQAIAAAQFRKDRLSELSQQHLSNLQRLRELSAERDLLVNRLDQAVIRSPARGMVTDLPFANGGMVVPPGGRVAEIARALETPRVILRVAPSHIDQVHVGQTGKITFAGLSSRHVPPLGVTIQSVSREAVEDAEGAPAYYQAEAQLDHDDLAEVSRSAGDRFRLAADMPLSATLTGRNTTLLRFLIEPVTAMVSGAFEDS